MLPDWMLTVGGWAIAALGLVGLLVAVAAALFYGLSFAHERLRLGWEYLWFCGWYFKKRVKNPDLAKMLDAANERAQMAEEHALRGKADGLFLAVQMIQRDLEQRKYVPSVNEALQENWAAIDGRGHELLAEWKKASGCE